MANNNKLTDDLKELETEVYKLRSNLKGINDRLNISYKYEAELAERMVAAKKQTEEIRQEFFLKTQEITGKYNEMKKIVGVFTGNFYSND